MVRHPGLRAKRRRATASEEAIPGPSKFERGRCPCLQPLNDVEKEQQCLA
jgi:hypothetical protein